MKSGTLKNPALPSMVGGTLSENIKRVCEWGWGLGWPPYLSMCVYIFIREFFFKLEGGIFIVYKVDMNSLKSHLL